MPYANKKGADQPAHSCSLISAFVVRCLDSITPILSKSKLSRLELFSVAEQAGLNLTWLETSKTGFLVCCSFFYCQGEKLRVILVGKWNLLPWLYYVSLKYETSFKFSEMNEAKFYEFVLQFWDDSKYLSTQVWTRSVVPDQTARSSPVSRHFKNSVNLWTGFALQSVG